MRIVDGRRARAAEDAGSDLADNAGDEIAVAGEAGVVEEARLLEVHLAAFDDGEQVARLDAVVSDVRHQRAHRRVARIAGERGADLAAPPRQLGRGDARSETSSATSSTSRQKA